MDLTSDDIFNLVEQYGTRAVSDFQARYFVVNSQISDYKRIHQAILEIEARVAAKKQIERNMKKSEIQKEIVLRDIEKEPDNLKKKLLQVDVEQIEYDLSVYNKKYRICLEELETFVTIVKTLVHSKEELEQYKTPNEEKERQYWILRMGKQAALDILSTGRIGQGNMDSIAMMPVIDQEKTISVAMKYSKLLNKGLTEIDATSNQELLYPDEILPSLETLNKKLLGE